jgi:hypothetical protein
MLQPGVQTRPNRLFTCDSMRFSSRTLKKTRILMTCIMRWFLIVILGMFPFKFIDWQNLEVLGH